jgi:hypothetical protein
MTDPQALSPVVMGALAVLVALWVDRLLTPTEN